MFEAAKKYPYPRFFFFFLLPFRSYNLLQVTSPGRAYEVASVLSGLESHRKHLGLPWASNSGCRQPSSNSCGTGGGTGEGVDGHDD